jgi:C4-dicarboxylate-specific signal transduction histidine kinase
LQEFDNGQPYLRGSVAAIESIITNLINNSLYVFEQNMPGERKIIVRTSVGEKHVDIHVLDNGPGIQGISKRDIWLPGQTTKENGTGLGLTIVRDAVIDLGGSVDAVEKGELGGAEIIISLPILGA